MAQIHFGNDLKDQLKNQKGARATRPLMTWYISPLAIGTQNYYLHVEKLTGLPVITTKLSSFTNSFAGVLYSLGFLTPKQQTRIGRDVAGTVQYRYTPDETSPMIAKYQQAARNHQQELLEEIKEDAQLPENERMSELAMTLITFLGDEEGARILNRFCKLVNEMVPVKINKPRSGARYCTITPRFVDPRKWQEFTGQDVTTNLSVVAAIKENNQKMIDQFFTTENGQVVDDHKAARVLLDDFLNGYLLDKQIRLVTTNLALVSVYYWFGLMAGQGEFPIAVFSQFFTFLSHTGIVSQATIKHLAENLQATLDTFYGGDDDFTDDQVNDWVATNSDLLTEYSDLIQKMGDQEELPKGLQRALESVDHHAQARPNKSPCTNPVRLEAVYEVRVSLADFTPRMSRKFYIAGHQSIANLQAVIITLFHGQFEHLYDLINEQTNDYYALPEFMNADFLPSGDRYNVIDATQATVSLLNPGDRLLLHYDYGDDWQFKVTIMQTLPNYAGYQPIVTSATGYGIIEDIGGVGALADYYHNFRRGHVDPEIREWLGGEAINLDLVNINELNRQLRQLSN